MSNKNYNARERYNLFVFVVFLTVLVGGTIVGGVFYNIGISIVTTISYGLAVILLGVGKLLFKEEPRPLPPPSKENILRSYLAVYAVILGIAIIAEIFISYTLVEHFEKTGRQTSIFESILILIVIPSGILIFWLQKRSYIIKKFSCHEVD